MIHCTFCVPEQAATYRCDCGANCQVYACERHRLCCAVPVKLDKRESAMGEQ